jgi:putative tributyrin esterase
MSFIQCDFYSESLQLATSMNVLLPHTTQAQRDALGPGYRFPTLYLLHGMSADHTGWQRFTSVERYTRFLNLAVVMPAVHRSFYTDQAEGYPYWTFVSEEVPAQARFYFPLATERERTFVAGLSMGGYGALKMGLRQPERFAAAASFSGAVDMGRRIQESPAERQQEMRRTFGDLGKFGGSDNDLVHIAEQLAASGQPVPRLFLSCGTEDFLYENNLGFRDHLTGLALDLTYEEGPGAHDWTYWDQQIVRCLAWLGVQSLEDVTGISSIPA